MQRHTNDSLVKIISRLKIDRALEHLASIELLDLCNEAKVERCRAPRDLSSCGRAVESVLNTCGHASLCPECSQRCDNCPICRIPVSKNGNRLRLRLYYECIEAGLISKRCDDRFQEKEEAEQLLTADVERLYSLFDVAIENNLVSLICHYVTDVCMDESAVSSDPIVAFLLDEVVVKDWCKRIFRIIVAELHKIYSLSVQEMEEALSSLFRYSVKLSGISNVLDVLESSFKGSLSAQFHDLHQLQECVLKTKQHMEMMIWCIRHHFLEYVRSRHKSYASWRSIVHERKAAAIKRSWPDSIDQSSDTTSNCGSTLFIEEALKNIDIEDGIVNQMGEKSEIATLQKEGFYPKIDGLKGLYPFENLRAGIDSLFLHGSSDMVLAKHAIFLYYLFDRQWSLPDNEWRDIVDDFAATFGITRHSLLESLTFYLLDDYTDEALQEACSILPEISGPTTHPKVAQVLLERQNPDAAFMVLRWSGRDGGAELVSLSEAVTAVRVRVECGLLTEAFMYQRMLCSKLKKLKLRHEPSRNASDVLKDDSQTWMNWVEALVTEICCLCIRRKLVDRILELPWDSDEEKYLHKCLYDFAVNEPLEPAGSLLVVFYLQRYRYVEAHQVDRKLHSLEQNFISDNSVSEEDLSKITLTSQWRAGLVDKSIELLPEVQQQLLRDGKLPELNPPVTEIDSPVTSDPKGQETILNSLLVSSSAKYPFVSQGEIATPLLDPLFSETPSKGFGSVSHSGFKKYGSTLISEVSLLDNARRIQKSMNGYGKDFNSNGITSSATRPSSVIATPLKDFNRSSLRNPGRSQSRDEQISYISLEKDKNKFTNQFKNASQYSRTIAADPVGSSFSGQGFHEGEGTSIEDASANGGPRWRSDDTSEDDEQQTPFPNGFGGNGGGHSISMRRARRSRFAMK
ncbi:hypothetical protein DCAR_0626264 [Daucus carota subsp. sativus]|uniref:RING-type domain-containing protein n=1 Tax=Daucus carota subsp. sativus TaxID=79200 RepID=A0AAF0XFH7_DAUCS|nr:hypothetical protein DCAR_0626264 [Daucus carota subsp. sativus]